MSYKEAIALISKEQDWKKICVRIAQSHPSIFVNACAEENKQVSTFETVKTKMNRYYHDYLKGSWCSWDVDRAFAIIKDNPQNKIQAIKFIREVFGATLRDSKYFVDEFWGVVHES